MIESQPKPIETLLDNGIFIPYNFVPTIRRQEHLIRLLYINGNSGEQYNCTRPVDKYNMMCDIFRLILLLDWRLFIVVDVIVSPTVRIMHRIYSSHFVQSTIFHQSR